MSDDDGAWDTDLPQSGGDKVSLRFWSPDGAARSTAVSKSGAVDGDHARQVVNFHTGFNLGLALLFLPLVTVVSRLLEKALPAPVRAEDPSKPRYLDASALETPALAIAAAARETLRMGDTLEHMLRDTSIARMMVVRSVGTLTMAAGRARATTRLPIAVRNKANGR